jgi:integrase
MNLALSSFKFFYNKVLKHDVVRAQRRPRQDKRLPVVLSKSEIKAVFDAEKNLKHRILLMMAYSSGFRVSEVVSLKRVDIDPARKTLLVNSGKRYTLLSGQVIQALKEYYFLYDIKTWIFPGQSVLPRKYLNTPSVKRALKKRPVSTASAIPLPLIYWKAAPISDTSRNF